MGVKIGSSQEEVVVDTQLVGMTLADSAATSNLMNCVELDSFENLSSPIGNTPVTTTELLSEILEKAFQGVEGVVVEQSPWDDAVEGYHRKALLIKPDPTYILSKANENPKLSPEGNVIKSIGTMLQQSQNTLSTVLDDLALPKNNSFAGYSGGWFYALQHTAEQVRYQQVGDNFQVVREELRVFVTPQAAAELEMPLIRGEKAIHPAFVAPQLAKEEYFKS